MVACGNPRATKGILVGMSQTSALDDIIMSSGSSILSWNVVQELAQGVQDEGLVRTPAEVADEVRLRLDRLQRAWETAKQQRAI
jgi:hypothetical protein